MDPNLFHLDGERLFEVLVAIVVLSFFIERALAVLFESRFFMEKCRGMNLKEILAVVVGGAVCWYWDFDAISMVFLKEHVTLGGELLTGAIIAGGSKGSIKLFHDVLKFKSTAVKEKEDQVELQKAEAKAALAPGGGK